MADLLPRIPVSSRATPDSSVNRVPNSAGAGKRLNFPLHSGISTDFPREQAGLAQRDLSHQNDLSVGSSEDDVEVTAKRSVNGVAASPSQIDSERSTTTGVTMGVSLRPSARLRLSSTRTSIDFSEDNTQDDIALRDDETRVSVGRGHSIDRTTTTNSGATNAANRGKPRVTVDDAERRANDARSSVCFRGSVLREEGGALARVGHTAIVYRNTPYIFGGMNKRGVCSNSVFAYNQRGGNWSELRGTGAAPAGRANHSAILYNNKMVIYGGHRKMNVLNDMVSYDFGRNVWELITAQDTGAGPGPTFFHSAVFIPPLQSMAILGGFHAREFNTHLGHIFDFRSCLWTGVRPPASVNPQQIQFVRAVYHDATSSILVLGVCGISAREHLRSNGAKSSSREAGRSGYSHTSYHASYDLSQLPPRQQSLSKHTKNNSHTVSRKSWELRGHGEGRRHVASPTTSRSSSFASASSVPFSASVSLTSPLAADEAMYANTECTAQRNDVLSAEPLVYILNVYSRCWQCVRTSHVPDSPTCAATPWPTLWRALQGQGTCMGAAVDEANQAWYFPVNGMPCKEIAELCDVSSQSVSPGLANRSRPSGRHGPGKPQSQSTEQRQQLQPQHSQWVSQKRLVARESSSLQGGHAVLRLQLDTLVWSLVPLWFPSAIWRQLRREENVGRRAVGRAGGPYLPDPTGKLVQQKSDRSGGGRSNSGAALSQLNVTRSSTRSGSGTMSSQASMAYHAHTPAADGVFWVSQDMPYCHSHVLVALKPEKLSRRDTSVTASFRSKNKSMARDTNMDDNNKSLSGWSSQSLSSSASMASASLSMPILILHGGIDATRDYCLIRCRPGALPAQRPRPSSLLSPSSAAASLLPSTATTATATPRFAIQARTVTPLPEKRSPGKRRAALGSSTRARSAVLTKETGSSPRRSLDGVQQSIGVQPGTREQTKTALKSPRAALPGLKIHQRMHKMSSFLLTRSSVSVPHTQHNSDFAVMFHSQNGFPGWSEKTASMPNSNCPVVMIPSATTTSSSLSSTAMRRSLCPDGDDVLGCWARRLYIDHRQWIAARLGDAMAHDDALRSRASVWPTSAAATANLGSALVRPKKGQSRKESRARVQSGKTDTGAQSRGRALTQGKQRSYTRSIGTRTTNAKTRGRQSGKKTKGAKDGGKNEDTTHETDTDVEEQDDTDAQSSLERERQQWGEEGRDAEEEATATAYAGSVLGATSTVDFFTQHDLNLFDVDDLAESCAPAEDEHAHILCEGNGAEGEHKPGLASVASPASSSSSIVEVLSLFRSPLWSPRRHSGSSRWPQSSQSIHLPHGQRVQYSVRHRRELLRLPSFIFEGAAQPGGWLSDAGIAMIYVLLHNALARLAEDESMQARKERTRRRWRFLRALVRTGEASFVLYRASQKKSLMQGLPITSAPGLLLSPEPCMVRANRVCVVPTQPVPYHVPSKHRQRIASSRINADGTVVYQIHL